MFNIFQMLQSGAGHPAVDNLARQFGLSPDQAMRATAALLPAFFMGLQRNVADPSMFSGLMGGSGNPFAAMFGNGTHPSPRDAQGQGEQIMGQIFGSNELARQVANQAATWSGVSAQVIQQMMPIVATGLAGSLSSFSEMMRRQGSPATATSAPSQPYTAWMEMMRAMTGSQGPSATPEPQQPSAPNPWSDMARIMMGQRPAAPAPETEPASASGEGWSQFVESGREAQQQYIASLQNIFDSFWGAGPDRR